MSATRGDLPRELSLKCYEVHTHTLRKSCSSLRKGSCQRDARFQIPIFSLVIVIVCNHVPDAVAARNKAAIVEATWR